MGEACVMNHWHPPVLGEPVLAMASLPGLSNFRSGRISSLTVTPHSWSPVPVGSPPWIMPSIMMRWKVMLL